MALRTFLGGGHTAKKVYRVGSIPTMQAGQGLRIRFTLAPDSYVEHLSAGGTGSAAAAAAALVAAWNASTDPRLAEATATVDPADATAFTVTSDVAGRDFGPLEVVNYGTVPEGWEISLNATQLITLPAGATGGTYTVSLGTETSGAIALTGGSAALQAALEAFAAIGPGNVLVTAPTASTLQVEFRGGLAGTAVALLAVASSLTGPGTVSVARSTAGVARIDEIQSLALSSAVAAGTFTLLLGTAETAALSWDATANEIEAALAALTGIAGVEVVGIGPFSIYFVDSTVDVTPLTVGNHLLGRKEIVVTEIIEGLAGESAQQWIVLPTIAAGGTFRVVYGGQTSSAIAYDANAAVVQAALEAMTSIGVGTTVGEAGGFVVTFGGSVAYTPVSPLVIRNELLSVQQGTVAHDLAGVVPVSEVQDVILPTGTAAGTWVPIFGGATAITALPYNANAAQVQAALQAMPSIGASNVSVTATSGGFRVTFAGGLANQDVSLLSATPYLQTIRSVGVSVQREGAGGSSETQRLVISAAADTGTFTMTFDDSEATAGLAPDVNAAVLQSELEGLSTIGAGNVAVEETSARSFLITFQATLANTNLPEIVIASDTLAGSVDVDVATLVEGEEGQPEIKTLVLPSPTLVSGGTYTVAFNGATSAAIAYAANAAQIQTALEAIASIGAGNIEAGTTPTAGRFLLTFQGDLDNQNLGLMTAASYWTVPGTVIDTTTQVEGSPGTNERQRIGIPASTSGGTWTLGFRGYTTSSITWNANTTQVQTALTSLSSIGSGNVAVTGTAGSDYYVTFQGALGGQDVELLEFASHLLFAENITLELHAAHADPVAEEQSYTWSGTTGSGHLAYDAYDSSTINYGDSAGDVATAIPTYEGAEPSGSGDGVGNGATTTITWDAGKDVPQATWVNESGDLGCAISTVANGSPGNNDIYELTYLGTPSGSFTLTVNGETTDPIPAGSNAAVVDVALEALTTIGDVSTWDGTPGVNLFIEFPEIESPSISLEYTPAAPQAPAAIVFVTEATKGSAVGAASEIQRYTFRTMPIGGTYTLAFNGYTTTGIAWNAYATDVQAALQALTSVGANNAIVSGSMAGGFTVTFAGALSNASLPQITASSAGLKIGQPLVSITTAQNGAPGVDEVQHFVAQSSPESGTYTITYGGSTAELDYDANAAQVQAALEAVPTIGAGNVVITGDSLAAGYTATFAGTLGGTPLDEIEAESHLVALHPAEISTVEHGGQGGLAEIQTVTIPTTVTSGHFTLALGGAETVLLPWNSPASIVQQALENLTSIGAGNVAVTQPAGNQYAVTFLEDLQGEDIDLMAVGNFLTGPSVANVVVENVGYAGRTQVQEFEFTFHRAGALQIGDLSVEGGRFWDEPELDYRDRHTTFEWATADMGDWTNKQLAEDRLIDIITDHFAHFGTGVSVWVVASRPSTGVARFSVNYFGHSVETEYPRLTFRPVPEAPPNNDPACGFRRIERGHPAQNQKYLIEIYADSGSWWVLDADGHQLVEIPAQSNAAQVQAALEAVSSIGASNVQVTSPSYAQTSMYHIEFIRALAQTRVELGLGWRGTLENQDVNMRVDKYAREPGRNAQHSVAFVGNAVNSQWICEFNVDDGWYQIPGSVYAGDQYFLKLGMTAAQLQAAANLNSNINGNLIITGGPLGTAPFTFNYTGAWANKEIAPWYETRIFKNISDLFPHLGVHYQAIDSGAEPVGVRQEVYVDAVPTMGTYTLTFNGYTTGPLYWQSNQSQITDALEALPSIGEGNVEVVLRKSNFGGITWWDIFDVWFIGAFVEQDVPAMIPNSYLFLDQPTQARITDVQYGGPLTPETQTFWVDNYELLSQSGSYILTFNDSFAAKTQQSITRTIDADVIHGELAEVYGWDSIDIEWSPNNAGTDGVLKPGDVFTIRWVGPYLGQEIPLISASPRPGHSAAQTRETKWVRGYPGANTQQLVRLGWDGVVGHDSVTDYTGGTFTLATTAGGTETAPIPYGAAAATVYNHLASIYGPAWGTVDVVSPGVSYRLTFSGDSVRYQPIDAVAVDASGLVRESYGPTVVETRKGAEAQNEIQRLTPATGATSGTWSLTFGGYTTGSLAYNATAAHVQTELDATFGEDALTATGGPFPAPIDIELGSVWAFATNDPIVVNSAMVGPYGGNIEVTVHVDGVTGRNASQSLRMPAGSASGSVTLTFDGYTTGNLDWDSTAGEVQTALRAVLGNDAVTCDLGPWPTAPVRVTFGGDYGMAPQDLIVMDGELLAQCPLAPTVSVLRAGATGANAKQRLRMPVGIESGTFALMVAGSVTGDIAYNADNATIVAAIVAVLGADTVTASGGPLYQAPVDLTFGGSYARTPVDLIVPINSIYGLLGDDAATISVVRDGVQPVDEVQAVADPADAVGGTFRLSYGGALSAPIAWNANATVIQARLEAMATIGVGNVEVTAGPLGTRPVAVEFTDELGGGPRDLLAVVGTVSVALAGISIEATQDGYSGSVVQALVATANAGPAVWDQLDNWADRTMPVADDDLVINTASGIYHNLPDGSVSYGTVRILALRGGRLGLPEMNVFTSGSTYPEYRPRIMHLPCDRLEIGLGDGPGTDLAVIDIGTGADTVIVVRNLATPTNYEPALQLTGGSKASTELYVQKGRVGLAMRDGEAAGFKTLEVANANGSYGDAMVLAGRGCELDAVESNGGDLRLYCGWSTLIMHSGYVYQYEGQTGAGDIAGGTFYHMSDTASEALEGDVPNFWVRSGGELDFSRDVREVDIALIRVEKDGKISGHDMRVEGQLVHDTTPGDSTTLRKGRAFTFGS